MSNRQSDKIHNPALDFFRKVQNTLHEFRTNPKIKQQTLENVEIDKSVKDLRSHFDAIPKEEFINLAKEGTSKKLLIHYSDCPTNIINYHSKIFSKLKDETGFDFKYSDMRHLLSSGRYCDIYVDWDTPDSIEYDGRYPHM